VLIFVSKFVLPVYAVASYHVLNYTLTAVRQLEPCWQDSITMQRFVSGSVVNGI